MLVPTHASEQSDGVVGGGVWDPSLCSYGIARQRTGSSGNLPSWVATQVQLPGEHSMGRLSPHPQTHSQLLHLLCLKANPDR